MLVRANSFIFLELQSKRSCVRKIIFVLLTFKSTYGSLMLNELKKKTLFYLPAKLEKILFINFLVFISRQKEPTLFRSFELLRGCFLSPEYRLDCGHPNFVIWKIREEVNEHFIYIHSLSLIRTHLLKSSLICSLWKQRIEAQLFLKCS